MCQLLSKSLCFDFRLLLGQVVPYLQFATTNCLNNSRALYLPEINVLNNVKVPRILKIKYNPLNWLAVNLNTHTRFKKLRRTVIRFLMTKTFNAINTLHSRAPSLKIESMGEKSVENEQKNISSFIFRKCTFELLQPKTDTAINWQQTGLKKKRKKKWLND